MRQHERRSKTARWFGTLAAGAAITATGVPVASAGSHSDGPDARSAASAGVVYGGRTSQGWPVVIELTKNGRRVTQAVIGLRLTCTAGGIVSLPDRYVNLNVSKRRKFRSAFGPDTERNADGTTTDFEGSISGSLNRARSKASGKWRFTLTEYDTAGAVIDICDSGNVSWSAKR